MRRAARSLGTMVGVLCCLAATAVPPAQAVAAGGTAESAAHHREARRAVPRPEVETPTAPERPPLSIETLSPSRLIPGTPVTVSGTVLNETDDVWGDAQVGMLVSEAPFTSQRQLSAAARADPYEEFAGSQVLAPGTFDDIGDIAPGQSRSFSFTVPYSELEVNGQDGVYWVGAELRVTDGDGLRGAAARTLTFMPLVGDADDAPVVELAMLWPLLAAVPWNGERYVSGSLVAQFADGGRLRTLAELADGGGPEAVTWVLEPAVLEAAGLMSDGFELGGKEFPEDSAQAQAAAEWLRLVRDATSGRVSLALPYGNPDVSALVHGDVRGMRRAQRAADRVLDSLGIARLGLLWPPGGRADKAVLEQSQEQLDAEVALLSRDTFGRPPSAAVVGLPSPHERRGSARQQPQPTLVVDRDQNRQGLRAQPGQSTLQWRQMILANTALLSLRGDGDETAIAMPSDRWWPDDTWRDADLFGGLRVPWIDRVTATALTSRPHDTYRGGFDYPPRARRRELGNAILDTVRRVRRTGRTVNNLLADPAENQVETDRAFGLSSSAAWRGDRETGREVAQDFLARNREMLSAIDLEAPDFVTLSSSSGRFPVSITNNLDQAVTVELAVTARDPRMAVQSVQPVTLQRDQRVAVTVLTNSRGVGITTVTARMMTQEGRQFGPTATFQVRTTQIGAVVWVIMGIGGAVLFVAAGRRIVQRAHGHRRRARGAR